MKPRWWRRGPSPEVERLARARGLVTVPPDGEVPRSRRVWERSRCGEAFATRGHPEVVVGNRSFVVATEAEPARMGLIAVRHGAALPHGLIRGGWTDGAGTLAAARQRGAAALGQLRRRGRDDHEA